MTSEPEQDDRTRWSTRKRIAVSGGVVAGVVVAVLLALTALVFDRYVVEGSSMYPTLESGDGFVVNRRATADVGEIVVAVVERDGRRLEFAKRVVAVAGDTISYEDCVLRKNGVIVSEPYLAPDERCGGAVPEMIVPEDSVYLLGDNRSSSQDSRSWGPAHRDQIAGVMAFRL